MTLLAEPTGLTQSCIVPLLYEDEVDEMGESGLHTFVVAIVALGCEQHFDGTLFRVFADLNTYFTPPGPTPPRRPCVAADVMIAKSDLSLDEHPTSYDLDIDPTPNTVVEVLSPATADKRDLQEKPIVYAYLGVREYILIDTTGKFLRERLLLKRLQPDGTWLDLQDPDGGITSELGFRIIFDEDGVLRVTDLEGNKYARPREARRNLETARQANAAAAIAKSQAELARAQAESAKAEAIAAKAAAQAEFELRRKLEEELARLRKQTPSPSGD